MKKPWDKPPIKDGNIDIQEILGRFAVPPPSQSAREAATRAALEQMDRRKISIRWSMMRQIGIEARFLPLWYYAASVLLAIAGSGLLLYNPHQAFRMGMLAGMTPLPVLLGLIELFHGADQGMAEMEAACRYSPARVLSARMLIIGCISCPISLLLGLCARSLPPVVAAGLVVVPYCMSASLGLLLSTLMQGRANSAQVAVTVAFINAGLAGLVISNVPLVESISAACWLGLMAGSALLFAVSVRILLRASGTLYERMAMEWN